MVEVVRTLTSNFLVAGLSQNRREVFLKEVTTGFKLANLANLKSAKMHEKTELGQLGQLFFDDSVGLEDSTPTYEFRAKLNDDLGWNLALPMIGKERAKLVKLANFEPAKTLQNRELGQLCQLFFDDSVSLEDSTPTYEFRAKLNDDLGWNLVLPMIGQERAKLVKLANFEPTKTLQNRELGQLCQIVSRMQIERNWLLDEIGRVRRMAK